MSLLIIRRNNAYDNNINYNVKNNNQKPISKYDY